MTAHFTFATWDGAGNQPPTIGIGQELMSRGHDVRFLGYAVQRKQFEDRGLAFDSFARTGGVDFQGAKDEERFSVLFGEVFTNRDHLDDLAKALTEHPADLLVVDCLLFGVQAAAEKLGIRTALLVHSAPGAIAARPEPAASLLMAAINRLRIALGLPTLKTVVDAWATFPAVVTTIRELDAIAALVPARFEYVGPVMEHAKTPVWEAPSGWDESLPLVLVSFTTSSAWNQISRIQNTLDGLAGQRYQVLVTNAQSELFSVPANATIRGYIPHAAVLPSTAVTVTHAGHGTVCASLAHGVPMVTQPNPAADQPALAARVEELGAGRNLGGEASASEIRTAVDLVLERPTYRQAARGLAAAIKSSSGAAGAADWLEVLAKSHRPLRSEGAR